MSQALPLVKEFNKSFSHRYFHSIKIVASLIKDLTNICGLLKDLKSLQFNFLITAYLKH